MYLLKVSLTLVGIAFFLLGCEEKFPVYASAIPQSGDSFNCLHYSVLNEKDKERLENAFGMKDDKSCTHRVELIKYKVGNCNNPIVKSVGGDFNGYVRVEIRKGFKTCYKVQSDYKNDMDAAFDRVLKKINSENHQKNNESLQ